jgi:hypothetical protein
VVCLSNKIRKNCFFLVRHLPSAGMFSSLHGATTYSAPKVLQLCEMHYRIQMVYNSFSVIDDYSVNFLLARHMPSADNFFVHLGATIYSAPKVLYDWGQEDLQLVNKIKKYFV